MLNIRIILGSTRETNSTVLLLGKIGTGKELMDCALHNRSSRFDRAFVRVNCAAIPSGQLESELFGHERAAFTGDIARKIGRFCLARVRTKRREEEEQRALQLGDALSAQARQQGRVTQCNPFRYGTLRYNGNDNASKEL